MSLSQGIPSYNLTFHQISSLIYDKNITSHLVNIKSLQKYFLTSLEPSSILNKHLQDLLQQEGSPNPYNHEVSKEICEKLWRRIVIKRNIYIGVIKFFSVLTSFLAPVMLDILTTLFKQTSSDGLEHDRNLGWVYCAILISNNFFGLLLETQYQFQVNKLKYEAKTVLQYLIYNKLTRLQAFGSENEPSGSQKIQANVNNLATIDTETIVGFFLNVHQTWSSFLSLCVVIVILFFKLRTALPIGLGMVIFLIWLSSRFVKVIGKMYSDVMRVKDKRIDLTSDVIKSIKAIKYLGWEQVFQKKIQDLRDEEFSYLSKIKYTDVFCILLWTVTSVTIVTITFLSFNYMGQGQNLHETNVFTIIAYFQMLINPLNSLPWTIGFIYQGSISFKRLKSFLDSKQSHQPPANDPATSDDNSIILRCDKITWPNNQHASDFELKDIRLNVNKGELVTVIGGVSSGKSALLNAILGEMKFYGNHRPRFIQGSIAYVPQTPWLQKNTIKENILFGKGHNKQLYEECIQICNLEKEIDELPGKDHYDVGPDGINLSGGQRQRLSLCRALYQNADIYLLDDILSSVDANVANVIYQKAIMGFLQKRGKTVILVLSQYKYLSHATQIWLMSDGQLIKDQAAISSYLKDYNEDNQANDQQAQSSLSEIQNISPEAEKISHEEPSNKDQQGSEINIEEQERGEIKFKSIKLYISSMGYSIFAFIFLTAFLMQASRAFYDFWLKSYLQASSQNQTPAVFIRSFETTLVLLTLLCYLTSSLRAFTFAFGNLKAARNLFGRLVPKVLYAKMTFFDKTSLGKILQRFSGDTFSLDDGVPFNWNMLLNNLTIFVGSMYIMIAQLPLMLFIIVPIMGVFYVLQRHFRRISREIKRLDSVYTGVVYTHLSETSEGLKIIRAFKKEKFMIDSFLNKIKLGLTTKSLLETMNLWLAVRIRSLSTLMITVLLCLAMYSKYYTQSGLDFNDFSLALMYAIANPVNFEDIIGALTAVEREFIGVERIGQFIENQTEEEDGESEKSKRTSQKTKDNKGKNKEFYSLIKEEEQSQSSLDLELANTEGFRQEQPLISKEILISFQNVSLSYLPKTSGKIKHALRNISFEVKRNQKIALCGRTGSGKTTILNCLIRLYEIDQGQIFFMGNNIQDLPPRTIRSSVAVIPQFGFMYEGTLRENLDPMGVIPPASLLKVLKKGKELIKTHSVVPEEESLIEENHDKIFNPDFYVEKNGRNLSSGERQIINFLRVLLQKPEVVFLDEATSNIDPNTDMMLQKSIFELCKDKTLITITHRLNYLEHYDQVIVLDDGEIVEMGKYQDLMAKENGKLQSFMKENQSVY